MSLWRPKRLGMYTNQIIAGRIVENKQENYRDFIELSQFCITHSILFGWKVAVITI